MNTFHPLRVVNPILCAVLALSLLVSCPPPDGMVDEEVTPWTRFFADNPGAVVRFGEFEATADRTDLNGSATFTLLKNGAPYMDAVITAEIDELTRFVEYTVVANQVDGPTVNWRVTVASLDEEGCEFEIGVFTNDGTGDDFVTFIPYNFCNGLIGITESQGELPAAFSATRTQDPAFDWLALQKMTRELLNAAPLRIEVNPQIAVASGMSTLGCITACGAAGGLGGWCASAIVTGAGASCCNPVILPLLVKWLDCLGI